MYLTSSLTWCTFLIYDICIYIYVYIVDSKRSLDLLHHVAYWAMRRSLIHAPSALLEAASPKTNLSESGLDVLLRYFQYTQHIPTFVGKKRGVGCPVAFLV